jgi:hypothetical protein
MLTSAVGGGGGGLVENMVYKGIAGNFISKITSTLGVGEGMAGTLSGVALPMIMEKIGGATQAAGDTDGIDQDSVMSALGLDAGSLLGGLAGGGAAGDLLGKAAGMLGGAADAGKGAGEGLLGKAADMLVFFCSLPSLTNLAPARRRPNKWSARTEIIVDTCLRK